jgi:signal transduction histidine kinase
MAEKRLMVQNEHLFKCAYMNSHEVRGPLARILGLIELSRLETDIDYRTFFEKMKQEANDIDKIVRMISDDLNKVQQYRHWFPRGMKADS